MFSLKSSNLFSVIVFKSDHIVLLHFSIAFKTANKEIMEEIYSVCLSQLIKVSQLIKCKYNIGESTMAFP